MTLRHLLPFLGASLLLTSGCKPLFDIRKAMYDQPKFEALEATDFFGDRRSARPLVPDTVAQGQLRLDDHLYLGLEEIDGEVRQAVSYPFAITLADLERGRERYEIYCSVCHGLSGHGDGMVVRRGFAPAPAFHNDRLRNAPPGYFYGVITNGFGQNMKSYAHQIPVEDRWRIAAYIKALQRSQFATPEDYERALAMQASTPSAQPAHSGNANEHR